MTTLKHRLRTRYSISRTTGLIAATALLLMTGCGTSHDKAESATPPQPQGRPAVAIPPPPPPPPPPNSVGANELGEIPVLMYHGITRNPSSVYERTPDDFRAEMERLARENYVPITTEDYATGHIDIPAGTHPVVLTFDDGLTSEVSLDANGNPAPDTAAQILLDVAAKHPGFRPVASFYVNKPAFGEPDGHTTLRWLHDHGFEVGNHTADHANLGDQTSEGTQHELADEQQMIAGALPGVPVRTMALPDGVQPNEKQLALTGSADGATYQHDAALLVGSNPAPSPFSADFDPSGVPRIRSEGPTGQEAEYGSTAWLDKLDANPSLRYTSAGDPSHITFPAGTQVRLADRFAGRARPY